MNYLICILSYLIIGFVMSYYFGKRGHHTTAGYITAGLMLLLWPLTVLVVVIGSIIALISVVAYISGRMVYLMDNKNEENKTKVNG